jgi:hypothetical protein
MGENVMSFAQVVCCVEVDISVFLLQAVNVPLLILTPFLFKNVDVLMWFALVWAEHQEMGFPWTLGIGDNDFRRDNGFHDGAPQWL